MISEENCNKSTDNKEILNNERKCYLNTTDYKDMMKLSKGIDTYVSKEIKVHSKPCRNKNTTYNIFDLNSIKEDWESLNILGCKICNRDFSLN